MSYYITQLEGCFVLRKTDEDSDIANPQSKKISENDYKVLYNSVDMRELVTSSEDVRGSYIDVKINGDASQILGKKLG